MCPEVPTILIEDWDASHPQVGPPSPLFNLSPLSIPNLSSTPSPHSEESLHELDAGDESLQRYKESLGLGGGGKGLSDPNDPRHCIILSLTMNSVGRPPVTIDLSKPGAETTLKDKPFKIREGAKFTMSAKFKVQHQILSGLHYVQVVKRKGIRVSKDQEMLVSSLCTISDRRSLKVTCDRDLMHQIPIKSLHTRSAVSITGCLMDAMLTGHSQRGRGTIWNDCSRPLQCGFHFRRRR